MNAAGKKAGRRQSMENFQFPSMPNRRFDHGRIHPNDKTERPKQKDRQTDLMELQAP